MDTPARPQPQKSEAGTSQQGAEALAEPAGEAQPAGDPSPSFQARSVTISWSILGTVPPEPGAPGWPRSVLRRRSSQVQRQDANGRGDPTTREEVGAPRGRTQRPLTAEQQQQQ